MGQLHCPSWRAKISAVSMENVGPAPTVFDLTNQFFALYIRASGNSPTPVGKAAVFPARKNIFSLPPRSLFE